MSVSISAVVLLLIVVILLIRKCGLRPAHAVASILLGFYLAGSRFAPIIQDLTLNAAQMIAKVRF
ncbi:hypothetical protein ACIBO6_02025 [Streptomyces luteogriseus]|jgi:hypothetical protein|uniref:hypothetical protein n=1 Tax=Streptomyces luteogriseus TaxID=68233 RepID=UPI0037A51334